MRNTSAVVAAWAVASVAVASASAAELLTNGSFEDVKDGRTVGWSAPEHYAFADGVGMNGTRGLVFENRDDKTYYAYPSAHFPFEKGKRYEYSVWTKTENLEGRVHLCVEWHDANHKWLSGSYQNCVGGTHDWVQVKGVTPPIPSDAASVRVVFSASKGATGKIWFDDASVRPLERPVFGGLYTSAYRNLAADGKVRFLAAVNLKEHPAADVFFSYTDAGGTVRRVKAKKAVDRAVLELDVAHLARGRHPVSCEVMTAAGQRLDGGSLDFTRTVEWPKRRVWIDGKRRTIVDGKPFFPLGIYLNEVTDSGDRFQNLLTGPFNCVMPYRAPDRAKLDQCRAAGLEVIYPINTVWSWMKQRPKGVDTDVSADAHAERVVESLKDHPAILAWYCNDEISLERFAQLLARQKLLERIDPGHPTWTVLYQYGDVRGYYPTFDVIGTDPYPIAQSPIGNVSIWTRTTNEEVMGLKPMWQVPQAFSWGDFDDSRKHADGRFPSRQEMLNMTWQCVANGANGIVYWCYRLQYQRGKFLVDRWADICAAANSVKPYVAVILSEEEDPKVEGTTENLSARAWRYQGNVYLVVVNNTREPVKGALEVRGADGKVLKRLQGDDGCELVSPGKVSVDLPPLGVSLVRLGA